MLSVLMGQAATFLPPQVLKWAEIGLFLVFGLKLLYEASQMPVVSTHEEEKAAAETVAKADHARRYALLTLCDERIIHIEKLSFGKIIFN